MAEETAPNKVRNLLSSFLTKSEDFLNNSDGEAPTSHQETDRGTPRDSDPRNRLLYYQRVESYTAVTWFAKPLELSPLVCARYGWFNMDTDMLQCVSCRAFLCAALPADRHSQQYKDSYDKLKQGLRESHKSVCKWASNPSPEWYMKLPVGEHGELWSDLQHRLHSLKPVDQLHLTLDLDTATSQGLSVCDLERLVLGISIDGGNEASFTIKLLAITGWTYCESRLNVLKCNYCRRRVGVWTLTESTNGDSCTCETNIDGGEKSAVDPAGVTGQVEISTCPTHVTQPGSSPSQNDSSSLTENDKGSPSPSQNSKRLSQSADDEPDIKKRKLNKPAFDPLSEHRFWCPWLLSTTEEIGVDSGRCQPAWLKIAQMLSPTSGNQVDFSAHMKKSPRLESLRHLRRVLHDCTSPKVQLSKETKVPHPVT